MVNTPAAIVLRYTDTESLMSEILRSISFLDELHGDLEKLSPCKAEMCDKRARYLEFAAGPMCKELKAIRDSNDQCDTPS